MKARFAVKASTIRSAGDGLFAVKPIAKGDHLRVRGLLIKRNSVSDRCTRYADAYKFRVGADLLLPLGWEGLINHSSKPNLVKVITGKKLFLRALRSITAGEELFFRYSRYAQKTFSATPLSTESNGRAHRKG